jgi:hypothetical protein
LVEYDLTYEPLHAMKGQVVADFIVNHKVETDDECLITMSAWSLFFLWLSVRPGVQSWLCHDGTKRSDS